MSRRPIEKIKRKVIGLLRSAKILIIRSLARSRIMVFQKIAEVGNLSWAGSTWALDRAEPESHPPPPVGADMLACQQLGVCEPVERSANISAIIKLSPTDERVGERLNGVAVVTLQLIDQPCY